MERCPICGSEARRAVRKSRSGFWFVVVLCAKNFKHCWSFNADNPDDKPDKRMIEDYPYFETSLEGKDKD